MAGSDRRRARAIALARPAEAVVPWWAWAVVAAGLMAAALPAVAQTGGASGAPGGAVPDKIAPPSAGPMPRSEGAMVGGELRPVPDSGVIKPPVAGSAGSGMVLQPPVSGTMPVIPPPAAAK